MKLDITKFEVKKPKDVDVDLSDSKTIEKIIKMHGGKTLAEKKYDGYGILVDNRNGLRLYSLSKNEWSPDAIPELCDDFAKLPKGFFVGELVGRPVCDLITTRFTKDDEFAAVKQRNLERPNSDTLRFAALNPLEIRVYDVLQLGANILADKSTERIKEILNGIFRTSAISPIEHKIFYDGDVLRDFAVSSIDAGSEGFVVKNPNGTYSKLNSEYVIGQRNNDWIKIKSKVTFDCAVLGLYQTEARLSAGWKCSNVLLGVYNDKTGLFETITKLTVPSKDLASMLFDKVAKRCDYSFSASSPYNWQNKKVAPQKSSQVLYSPSLMRGSPNEKVPFMYVREPKKDAVVLEVQSMQVTTGKDSWHSCGLQYGLAHSLRQPVYVREREKKPLEATTTRQIMDYMKGV